MQMVNKLKENYFLRFILYKILNGFETSRKIKGVNYKLFFNAGTNFNFFFKRELQIENEASENLAGIIKENFLVFDVGAHIGYYTVILSSHLKSGSIIAFEPDKENLKYLKKNVEENSLTNVTIINKAVSNKAGESVFYKDINTGRTSSLESNAWHPNAAETRTEFVNTTTVDDSANHYGIPNFIKCDVEGHELSVLKGAMKVLNHKPILFIEVIKENRIDVLDILKQYDYKIFNAELTIRNQSSPLKEINCSNILCL
jgi:FkbM family methyltransferase